MDTETPEKLHERAKAGCADAQFFLGRRCWRGDGVPCDPGLGLYWLGCAAASGHVVARIYLEEFRHEMAERAAPAPGPFRNGTAGTTGVTTSPPAGFPAGGHHDRPRGSHPARILLPVIAIMALLSVTLFLAA